MLSKIIKESVGLKRVPRNLDIFYYFKYVYNQTNNTISSTLTRPFISTAILQNRLGLRTNHYKPYFDAWIEDFVGNPIKGKMCRYVKWSPIFIKLMADTAHYSIPKSFIKKVAYKTIDMNKEQIEMLRRIHNNNNHTISSTLTDFYHSTQTSSFRLYHPLQTLKREEKKQAFKDMYDVDIDSCFSSICYHELGIKDERLNPALKQEFRSWVQKELGLDSIQEAKEVVSRLFTGQHTQYNQYPWFNQLFNRINDAVWKEIKSLQQSHPEIQWSHHQYFTHMEQRLIDKVLPECNLVLRMHDGFITGSMPNMDEINRLAYPHRFSLQKI